MNKIVTSCLAALALAACSAEPAQPPLSAAPLAGAAIGGPFTLIDQDGKQRSYDEFNGKYRLVYFGYTQCPDICTPDVQNLMAGLTAFEKANPKLEGKVQPLFITVDPKRDTPAVLKQFVSSFHPRLIGLTGSEEQTIAAAKAFAIYASRVEGSSPENYLMSHSQTPYLMGPDGKPLDLLTVDQPKAGESQVQAKVVTDKLARWVR